MKRADLISEMVNEFHVASTSEDRELLDGKFPLIVQDGEGSTFRSSIHLQQLIQAYSRDFWQSDPKIRKSLKRSTVETAVEQALVRHCKFSSVTCPPKAFEQAVNEMLGSRTGSDEILLGCTLLADRGLYPIEVGRVTFWDRRHWATQQQIEGHLSTISTRRLLKLWSGERVSRRKSNSWDAVSERSVVRAIDIAPVICSVKVSGMETDVARQKATLSARLAITAIAMLWATPSRALMHMNLTCDGLTHRYAYAIRFKRFKRILPGMGTNRFADGRQITGGRESLHKLQPFFDAVGNSLTRYLDSSVEADDGMSKRLFLAMWHFTTGCRSDSDHVAVASFANSLDAMVGGTGVVAILASLKEHFGIAPDTKIFGGSVTARRFVEQLYNDGRSRFFHGSSDHHHEDWSKYRDQAEILTRDLIVSICLNP